MHVDGALLPWTVTLSGSYGRTWTLVADEDSLHVGGEFERSKVSHRPITFPSEQRGSTSTTPAIGVRVSSSVATEHPVSRLDPG